MNTFALFVAPWDLAERGTRNLLRWARDQGLNTIYLATVYHAGWFLHPHHRRKAYMVEDGTCYFHSSPAEYERTPLKPKVAHLAAEKDWLAEACEVSRDLGLKIICWTVCLHNTRMGLEHPELTCRNVYGDSYPHALCPTNPAVQEYVCATVRDQAARYSPDGFLLEATRHHRGRTHGSLAGGIHGHHHERDGLPMPELEQHLLNASFAETDRRVAEKSGVDTEHLCRRVKDHLDRFFAMSVRRPAGLPDTLDAFYDACPDLRLYERLLEEHENVLISAIKSQPQLRGIPLIGCGPCPGYDSILVGCYNQPEGMLRSIIEATRANSDPGQSMLAGVRLGFNPPPETSAVNSKSQGCRIIRTLQDCEIDGVAFYFYGESPAHTLEWIRPMIETAQPVPQAPKPRPRSHGEIGVGLIGAGAIGEVHLQAFRQITGVRLRAVTDVDADRAKRMAAKLHVDRVLGTAEAIVGDSGVDLVIVATPPASHVQYAQLVLAADKHLLLEKPLGICLAEADAIVDAVNRSRGQTGIALVHRYDGLRIVARELIQTGAIGPVRRVRYRSGRNMYKDPRFDRLARSHRAWLVDASIAGGGILPSSTIHTLSLISFLLQEPRAVSLTAALRQVHPRPFDRIEDDVTLLLGFENGTQATIEESWATDLPYEMSVEGEFGYLRFAGPRFNEVSLTGVCAGCIPASLRSLFEMDHITLRPCELDEIVPPYFDGLAADMTAACRAEARQFLPGACHARNMRAIIAAADESNTSGKTVGISWRTEQITATDPGRAVSSTRDSLIQLHDDAGGVVGNDPRGWHNTGMRS